MTSQSSMICPARLNHGRWCGLALAAVYVPPDKNSEFEAISYAWKMSGAIGTDPEFHAGQTLGHGVSGPGRRSSLARPLNRAGVPSSESGTGYSQ
jgi:hypothetical protein